MWQTQYTLAVPKYLGVGVNFRQCSEDYFSNVKGHSPFYSAPSIFAVLRNLVREKWFQKYG